MIPEFLITGPETSKPTIALAHGAGAAMDSPFMDAFARGLAGRGVRVVRFEFPYMAERRTTGRKRPPDRAAVLIETWKTVIGHFGADRLVIGGKSMGGRIASMVADAAGVLGLVCLGYPFHAPGRPEKTRTEHLASLKTPALFLQGTRDSLGGKDEVSGYALSPAIHLHWLEDGDHGFKPRKKSGRTETQNWEDAIGALSAFATSLDIPGTRA